MYCRNLTNKDVTDDMTALSPSNLEPKIRDSLDINALNNLTFRVNRVAHITSTHADSVMDLVVIKTLFQRHLFPSHELAATQTP
jgi:hypothetical protein